jgi:hypothetical protein
MRHATFWRVAVIIVTAGGLGLAGAGTALAGRTAAPDPDVTIGTASAFVQVTGDTLVRYGRPPGPDSSATVSGSVTGIPAGLTPVVVTLLDRPFHAAAFTSTGAQATLTPAADGSATYSFSVTPTLATSYKVQVSEVGALVPLTTSAAATVYVIPDVTVAGSGPCSRPTCTGTLTITSRIPAAAYATEAAKPLKLYTGMRKSPGRTPAAPANLSLTPTAYQPVAEPKLSAVRYTVRYSFKVGASDGYQWKINYCTTDTEAADGLGLPHPHGCGNPTVSATASYLG